jgi:hypothetical protein
MNCTELNLIEKKLYLVMEEEGKPIAISVLYCVLLNSN